MLRMYDLVRCRRPSCCVFESLPQALSYVRFADVATLSAERYAVMGGNTQKSNSEQTEPASQRVWRGTRDPRHGRVRVRARFH